ncbi:MAG: hypothetical protein AAGG46_03930, partial [Planctomycetota bacterium]
ARLLAARLFALASLILGFQLGQPVAEAQRFWQRFMPVDRVEADPNADYSLQQTSGPWLIMAATFQGEGAERQARDLALELRTQHNLKTYLHDVTLDLTEGVTGRGVDRYGAPLRMRYRTGNQAHEWAVLVGDFQAVDESVAQNTLEKVKRLRPQALELRDGQTAQSLAQVRAAQSRVVNRLRASTDLGPMRAAFITRNPMLPKEYFAPKGVDNFVEKMNRGVEHSLLDAGGKYTVKVATFKGRGEFESAAASAKSRRGGGDSDALMLAAENAHLLVERMREQGWPAYEFHDRHESVVTVGSFDSVSRRTTAGESPVAEVQQILQTFGAAYNTPADPLLRFRPPTEVQAQASRRLSSFNQRFNGQHGQIAGGYQPKFVRAEPKNPNSRIIPFDIHPHVMEIPKRSISSSFAWRR